jgi:hypothetical protein
MDLEASMAVQLGTVTCPSGELVVVDTGYLGMWTGERSPSGLDPEILGLRIIDTARDAVEDGVDARIVGTQAEEAARLYDRQAGVWLYDIPGSRFEQMRQAFRDLCRQHGLDADLVAETQRVSHRDRVRRAAPVGGQEFIVFGVPVVAVGGLPVDRPLTVEGRRRDYGDLVGSRWEQITVVVGSGTVARTTCVGYIGVDWPDSCWLTRTRSVRGFTTTPSMGSPTLRSGAPPRKGLPPHIKRAFGTSRRRRRLWLGRSRRRRSGRAGHGPRGLERRET